MSDIDSVPEKRTDILYSRITPDNKKWLKAAATKRDVSESALVNHILDIFRKKNAGDAKKSKRSA